MDTDEHYGTTQKKKPSVSLTPIPTRKKKHNTTVNATR